MIGSLSADQSLFMCGGADNRLFILNVAWLLEGEQEGAQAQINQGYNNGVNTDDKLNHLENGVDEILLPQEEEEEEEVEESSASDEVVAKASDDETSGSDASLQSDKLDPNDSSFSDFFKFEKRDLNQKEKLKQKTYGKARGRGEAREFFKDL